MSTTTPLASSTLAAINGGAAASKSANDEAADRFLTLLVTQIKNQDPLNPMDNAQVTTQMAQINTVTGIEKLNRTVASLSTQFASLQLMQGAALVGRDVTVPGDALSIADGAGRGSFDLAGAADRVKVEILGPAGQVVDTLNLGAESAGRHDFEWPAGSATNDAGLRFRVTATRGSAAVTSTTLMRDRVESVAADGDTLTLELARAGRLAWADVRAFN